MSRNNYTYTVCLVTKQSSIDSFGFEGGVKSIDGTLIVVDKRDSEKLTLFAATPKPSYVSKKEFPNWPYLDQDEADDFTTRKASGNGRSDGYCWTEA